MATKTKKKTKKPVRKVRVKAASAFAKAIKKSESRYERMIDYTFKVTVSVDPEGVSGVHFNKSLVQQMLCAALEQYKDLSCGPIAPNDPTSVAFERIAIGSEFEVKR